MHTLHINCFGCKWPMKKSYQEHLKTMLHLAITLQKKNLYDLIWNFGQLQKISNTAGFLYLIHTYCHYICLYDNTSKFNFSTLTANITWKYILVK